MVKPVILLRHTEAEAAIGAYSHPAPGSVSGRLDRAEQGAATESASAALTGLTVRRDRLATTEVTKTARFDTREALRVTLCMFGTGFLAKTIIEHLIAATFGMLMPFPVGSGTVRGAITFGVLALNVAVVGFVAGMLTNRRTMTASIVAANVFCLLITALFFTYVYVTLPREAWGPNTFPVFRILLQAVTVTATEVAVAHYVARKLRKEA